MIQSPHAQANPPILPFPPPYVPAPGNTPAVVYPGATDYRPYYQYVLPPSATDTRGVRTGTNADPSQSNLGLPGSKLGESTGAPNQITAASARYGIQGGLNPPQPPAPGFNAAAGSPPTALEDPTGAPPKSPVPPEAAGSGTDAYGGPLPGALLEPPTAGSLLEPPTA
ncbi:hypothetical protein [Mycolicibacterium sp. P9-64]|uniref:hypothetical protein n=1 Tax=Mycolicibacterium sp. P9-64 TaxID=2024612 RepID=UPI0011ED4E5E|nr:hypothetical protein [Mycolicibacterium sp. P9-64]